MGVVVIEELSLASLIQVLVQLVLPLLVAVVTKAEASARVKSLLLAGLTAVNGFAVGFLESSDWKVLAANTLIGFAVSVATLYGLWKPTGAAEAAAKIGVR